MANLKINRGTTYTRTLTYKENGTVTPLTGCTVFFTMKDQEYDSDTNDTEAEAKKTLTDLQDDNAADGIAIIVLDPEDTAELTPGEYFYDIKVKKADGTIYKVDEGTIALDGSPTNRTS